MPEQSPHEARSLELIRALQARISELEHALIHEESAPQDRSELPRDARMDTRDLSALIARVDCDESTEADHQVPYGDLTALNRNGIVLQSLGQSYLRQIVREVVDLLGTSSAVYETDGSYALGLFSSGWCRFLDEASRKLCQTDDNAQALASGRWHCHESCWSDASRVAIATGAAVDVSCRGGLRLFALPIRAKGEIVGSVNFGYGSPPTDSAELQAIAENYDVSLRELVEQAAAHPHTPDWLVRFAKRRLVTTARLIGELVERKRAESETRQLKERAERYLELAGVMFIGLDPDGLVTLANAKAGEVLGCDPSTLLGRDWFADFLPPACTATVREAFRKLLASEDLPAYVHFENAVLTAQGDERLIAWHNSFLRDEDGTVTGTLSSGEDITDVRAAAAKQKALEAQLLHVQKLESLGVLAGGIAHDFNNILAAIMGNASLALDELPRKAAAREYIELVITASQQAAKLTTHMLAYAGKGQPVREPLDLKQLVFAMEQMLRVSVSKKATMLLEPGPTPIVVQGDGGQLSQVIINLITNASEALENQPGTITLTTGIAECDHGYLSRAYLNDYLPSGTYAFVDVADTGCGMGPETLSRIFDPFFSTKFAGRGLGLAASLGIVRAHRGTMFVDSAPQHGTRMRVLLPAIAPPVAASAIAGARTGEPASQRAAPPSSGQRAHAPLQLAERSVLVVDDEPSVRYMAATALSRAGCDVVTAADGSEAIERFRAEPDRFACVVLDLTMPRVDGREAASQIRKLRPEQPVVLSSGYDEAEAAAPAVSAPSLYFLHKPYTAAQLVDVLRRVMRSRP